MSGSCARAAASWHLSRRPKHRSKLSGFWSGAGWSLIGDLLFGGEVYSIQPFFLFRCLWDRVVDNRFLGIPQRYDGNYRNLAAFLDREPVLQDTPMMMTTTRTPMAVPR